MSKFTELLTEVDTDCDQEFGDLTRIEPIAAGEIFSGAPDAKRKPFEVIGIVENETAVTMGKGERSSMANKADVHTSKVSVSYAEKSFEGNYIPQKGDVIVLLGEKRQPRMRVSRLDPDGEGRVTIYVDRI